MIKTLIGIAMATIALMGCKVVVESPAVGHVETKSGVHFCPANSTCEIDVVDSYFDEEFIAVSDDPNYRFKEWKTQKGGFCGGITTGCRLSTKLFAGNDGLLAFLETEQRFYIEPIFEKLSEDSQKVSEGLWIGSTSNGQGVQGLVLPDGSYYFIYSVAGNSSLVGGVVLGSSSTSNGEFTSSNARDFNLEGAGILNAKVTGAIAARNSFEGSITYPNGYRTSFTTSYSNDYEIQPTLESLTGEYRGTVAFSLGYESASFYISATGDISGRGASGCQFGGKAIPKTGSNAYDITLKFSGHPCYFSNTSFSGVAYLDQVSRQLYVILPNGSRTDGLFFIGS